MAVSVTTDMLNAVEEQALDQCMEITLALLSSQLGPDGSAYGDVLPDRADRIARFIDLAERGVLDALASISPQTHDMLLRDYVRDITASPLIGRP